MQDMLLRYTDEGGFQTVDEWLKTMSADKEGSGKPQITKEQIQESREEFDKQVAKASLDLAERGPLKTVESLLIEQNGDWACVYALYRFEDGSSLAKDQYDDKKAVSARFAPDGYYFLKKSGWKWFILDTVPHPEEQRFSVTTAAALLGYLLNGQLAESRILMSDSATAAEGSDPLSELAKDPEYKSVLDGWSLKFKGRRENERMTVVSYEIRAMDAEQTVQTANVPVIVRLRNGHWEVDQGDVSLIAGEIRSLASRLDLVKQTKAQREAEELRQSQSQPVPTSNFDGTMTWRITDRCDNTESIRFRFFTDDRALRWPAGANGADYWYTEKFGQSYDQELLCPAGRKICYGAWQPNHNLTWGAGEDGTNLCTSCCYTCDGNVHPMTLTCD